MKLNSTPSATLPCAACMYARMHAPCVNWMNMIASQVVTYMYASMAQALHAYDKLLAYVGTTHILSCIWLLAWVPGTLFSFEQLSNTFFVSNTASFLHQP